jgi:hypothetical protein
MIDALARLLSRHRKGRRFNPLLQAKAYQAIPQGALADLAEFCGAVDPAPEQGTEFQQGRAAGRRDVWLRIAGHRSVRDDEIFALLRGEGIAAPRE